MADLCAEARAFATQYVSLWSTPPATTAEQAAPLAQRVAYHYRPGFTFFTNGEIERFENQAQAAALIEAELRAAIGAGIGAHLTFKSMRTELLSETSVLCWIKFVFRPAVTSGLEAWTFTNLYGYRAETKGIAAGWEFVVRDQEADEMRKVTHGVFGT